MFDGATNFRLRLIYYFAFILFYFTETLAFSIQPRLVRIDLVMAYMEGLQCLQRILLVVMPQVRVR